MDQEQIKEATSYDLIVALLVFLICIALAIAKIGTQAEGLIS